VRKAGDDFGAQASAAQRIGRSIASSGKSARGAQLPAFIVIDSIVTDGLSDSVHDNGAGGSSHRNQTGLPDVARAVSR